MSHKVKPGQQCVIRTIEVAFPAETSEKDIEAELKGMLTDHGTLSQHSNVADWRYIHDDRQVETRASFEPVDGEIFTSSRTNLPKRGVKKTLGQTLGERAKKQLSALVVVDKNHYDTAVNVPRDTQLLIDVVHIPMVEEWDEWAIQDLIKMLTRTVQSPLRDKTVERLRRIHRAAVKRDAANADIPDDNV